MSRIGLFWRAPVDVLSLQDRQVEAAITVPEVGLRWGAPSAFEHGLPAAVAPDETPGIVIDRGRARVVRGTEVHREFGEELPAGARPVESIKRATFYLGEHEEVHEQRTVQGNVTTVEPIVETVREYLEFDFAFTVEGERGTPPPPATEPPRPSPKIADVSDLGPFRTIVKYQQNLWRVTYSYFQPVDGFNFHSFTLLDPNDPGAASWNPPLEQRLAEWPENAVAEREANGLIIYEIVDWTKQDRGPIEYTSLGVPYVGHGWTLTIDFTYTHADWGDDERTFGGVEFVSATGDGSDWHSFVPASARAKPDFRLEDGPSPATSS